MNIDQSRINKYLMEITKTTLDLNELIDTHNLEPNSIALKAAKYMLVELAEAISNTLQHILAKEKGIPVSGYIDTIVKAHDNGVISDYLYNKLKPFLDFRNSLIHRYWAVDDTLLVRNIIDGRNDFDQFVNEIGKIINKS